MKTDALSYQVFQLLPRSYFELIGASAATAGRYTFASEELKQVNMRIDGIFLPTRKDDPVHFVEIFFYKTPRAYSNLFAKVFLWLETKNPAQDWHACIIFASRRLEPAITRPYQALLDSGHVTRVYLDELPPAAEDQLGLGILEMIVSSPELALTAAKKWRARVDAWKEPVPVRRRALELIELAVLGHFPSLSRKELEHMLKIRDFRETKVYQEALEEGREQGVEQGREEGLEKGLEKGREKGREEERRDIALRMLAKGHSVAEVSGLTGLSAQRVRALKKSNGRNDG